MVQGVQNTQFQFIVYFEKYGSSSAKAKTSANIHHRAPRATPAPHHPATRPFSTHA